MIKCPECKKDVSESAKACPSCGHPVATVKDAVEKKQGCGGCLLILGVLVLIAGLITFVAARKNASSLIQQNYENRGLGGVIADDTLAKAAGEESYSGYLANQNRESGLIFICVGIAMGVIGFRMCKQGESGTLQRK